MKFTESLKKNVDFKKVYDLGKSVANQYLVLYVLKNESQQNRLGFSISKKVGNSVVRHRLRRMIKEGYRLEEQAYEKGLDMVVIARIAAKNQDYHSLKKALEQLGKKQGIFR